MKARLFGTPESVYVRIVRMILDLKDIPYELVLADVFSDRGLPENYEARHPFRRIPSIEIGDADLFETDAIAHYLDAIHPDPPLIPTDPLEAARMRQIMRVIDNYAYRALVWEIYVPQWWRGGMAPSAQALTAGEHVLASLDRLMTQAFRISPPTLGWCYLVSMLAAADSVTAGSDLIDRVPTLRAWWNVARTSHLLTNTRSDQTLY